MWLGRELSPMTWHTLNLRLDEFGVGGVTPSNLENMIKGESLKEIIYMHIEGDISLRPYYPFTNSL